MAESLDPYKILQVDPEAEDEVIQAAYRRLAQKYHPDRAAGTEASDRMVAINAAWELVRTRTRRTAYDLAREASRTRGSQPSHPGAGGADRRTAQPEASRTPPPAAGPTQPPRPGGPQPGPSPGSPPSRPAETVSRDWTPGRSSSGGGYDARTMHRPDGLGAAGPPPGNPSGSVMTFGRYAGWSVGEIGRTDLEYIEWLDRMPIGRPYRVEIDAILRQAGRRRSAPTEASQRRGLFRRR